MILEEMSYPDHYAYTVNDVVKLGERAAALNADLVLTTEKDAGKIRPYLSPDDGRWWAARLRVEWLRGEAAIRNMIMDAKPTIHEGVRA
jgi:tetraacyldisaccharide 4'-kinase